MRLIATVQDPVPALGLVPVSRTHEIARKCGCSTSGSSIDAARDRKSAPLLLRAWFADIPASERERLTVAVGRFGENNFVTISGPPVCSLSERAAASGEANRAWNKLAILEAVPAAPAGLRGAGLGA
jgi:hypothetical protein